MATNKFATMLHRNTHKIILILVYAVLEWILIFLLLLNSLFSFLISKFASYFGLKPPCLWCSRVDHLLDPNKNKNSYSDLVCEAHASEISKLGYCPNHRKLAATQNLCKDCLSTQPKYSEKPIEISRKIAFFTWVSEKRVENGGENSKCSCCDEILSSKLYPSFLFFKPSWGALGYKVKGDLNAEAFGEDNNEGEFSDTSQSDCSAGYCGNAQEIKQEKEEDDAFSFEDSVQICCREDESFNIMNLHTQISNCGDVDRLIPISLIDSSTVETQLSYETRTENHLNGSSDSEPQISEQVKSDKEAKSFSAEDAESEAAGKTRYGVQENLEIDDQLVSSSVPMAGQGIQEIDKEIEAAAVKEEGEEGEDDCGLLGEETKSQIFTGMEASGRDLPNQIQGSKKIQNATSEEVTILAHRDCEGINLNDHLSANSKLIEGQEEKFSEMAISTDGLHHLHKKQVLSEKREYGTEEACEGSVSSEMEGGDGALTIEKLKSALIAERKSLSALYAELEEERSAAAIAANQTMAMITRLQEEKAAMQMEALQYQRMMEEQSEYDQEALQLLNELMIKREKEKLELEKELELYRRKVFDYEAKEKMMTMRVRNGSARSRNSSACGNAEDTDEMSVDLNREARDEESSFYEHQEGSTNNTPIDAVLNFSSLDESLAEFEEERLCILEELKALEEKLFTLADNDEDQVFQDVKPIGKLADYREDDDNYDSSSLKNNGFSGNSNGEHYTESIIHAEAKKLLPLFDATCTENGEGNLNAVQNESDPSRMQSPLGSKFEPVNKKLAIEEEVDHVYERLQALETDREFLKHCISSIKKGDKGMDLLQEILQHLRDLRTVELRARNICDSPLL